MNKRHALGVTVCIAVVASSACAGHGVAHVAPDESRPHISWEIRSGGDVGDRDFVCGSAGPRKVCILAASKQRNSTLAALHLSVHPAAQQTNYVGFMRANFLQGDGARKIAEVSATIAPGDRVLVRSVVGAVRAQPGEFELEISVDAFQPGAAAATNIAQRIAVTVK